VARCCVHRSDTSGSLKSEKYLDWLSTYCILKEYCKYNRLGAQFILSVFIFLNLYMFREKKKNTDILRINCSPSWLYLQYYTEMHVQQNIKL